MNKKILIIILLTLAISACNIGGVGGGAGLNNAAGQNLKIESGAHKVALTAPDGKVTGIADGLFDLISGFIANQALSGIWGAAVSWLGFNGASTTPDPKISQILNIVQAIQSQISTQTNLIWQAYQAQTGAFEGQAAVNMAAYFQNINLLWLNVQSSGMTPTQTNAWVNGGFTSQMEQQLFESSSQDIYDDLISSIQTITKNVYYISGTNSDTMGPDLTTPLELLLNAGIQNAVSNYMVLNPNLSTVRKAMDDNSDTNSTENIPTNNAFVALYNFYQFVVGVNGQVTQYLVQAYQVEQLGVDLYYSGYLSQSQQQELQATIGPDLNINLSQAANIANLQSKYETFAKNTNSLVAGAITNLRNQADFNTIPGNWTASCGNNVSVDDFLSINGIAGLDESKFVPSNGNPPNYYYDGANTLRTLCRSAGIPGAMPPSMVTARYSTQLCGAGNQVTNSNGRLTCSNPHNMNQNITGQVGLGFNVNYSGCYGGYNPNPGFNIYYQSNTTALNLVTPGELQWGPNSLSAGENACGDDYTSFISAQINNIPGYDFGLVSTVIDSPQLSLNCLVHDLSCTQEPYTVNQNSSTISYSDGRLITLEVEQNSTDPTDPNTQLKMSFIPPSGSYASSCSDINYENGVLSANCNNGDKGNILNYLNYNDYCVAGSGVSNKNGILVCPIKPGVLPGGSWSSTANDINFSNNQLSAYMMDRNGNLHQQQATATVNSVCTNNNGTLQCN
jgi:hypothetical protein